MLLMRVIFIFFLVLTANFISAQVTSDFVTTNNQGCPNPFLATAIDNSLSSSGNIVSWNWILSGPPGFTNFTSINNSINAPLTIPGFYDLTLTACDDLGNCDTHVEVAFFEVFEVPVISYQLVSGGLGCSPLEACFEGTVDPVCGTLQSSFFDMRDGTVLQNTLLTDQDFCYSFISSGMFFDFVVSFTNSCGCSTTEVIADTVQIVGIPQASFTSPNTFSCDPSLTTTITSTSSSSSLATLEWSIPQLNVIQVGNSITETFTEGNYDVQLIVTEPDGCADTLLIPNYIVVGSADANFTASATTICTGESVTFEDISNGTPNNWNWSIPGVGNFNGSSIDVVFNNEGTFDVELTTTFPGGCSETLLITNFISVLEGVTNSFTVSDSSSCELPFTTTFTSSTIGAANTSFTFPGGNPNSFNGPGPVNVTYNSPGVYSISMNSESTSGCETQTTFSNVITVDQLEIINVTSDSALQGCIPFTVNLNFELNLAEQVDQVFWNLPESDLGTSTDENPILEYSSIGCFEFDLTVTTLSGCVATYEDSALICAGDSLIGSFIADTNMVCYESDTLCFTYTGDTLADLIFWDFGDGATFFGDPVEDTACHYYDEELGIFSVSIVPFYFGCPGDTFRLDSIIEVLGPIAEIRDSFDCSNENLYYFFSESEEADSLFWTFGDLTAGGTDVSSEENPTYLYPDTGNYEVTLTAYNFTTGCINSDTIDINIYTSEANFEANLTEVCAGTSITFTNTSQFPGAGGRTRWDWDFSDGITFPGNVGAFLGPSRTRVYNTPGIYSVSMRNEAPNGCRDTITRFDYITVHGIIGGFTTSSTREGCAPVTVDFVDTSFAPISGVASWQWDFGDGNTSSEQDPSHTYTSAGIYNVSLVVVDSFGCSRSINNNNYVTVQEPIADFSVNRDFICNNQTVQIFNNSQGNNLQYNWSFTNATPDQFGPGANPPTITFNVEGVQIISLVIEDNLGCTDSSDLDVSVFDVVADGFATPNFVGCFTPPVPISLSNTSLNNVDINTVLWDFGNGITSNQYNPSITFLTAGVYPITLSVSSLTGCTDTQIIDTVVIDGPYGEVNLIDTFSNSCPCTDFSFEIVSVSTNNPIFLPGDGNAVIIPNTVLPGDTLRDTIVYTFCDVGTYQPQIFIDDGNCAGNVLSQQQIVIDEIISSYEFIGDFACDSATVCFFDLSENEVLGSSAIINWSWDFGDGNTQVGDSSVCNFYAQPGNYEVELVVENSYGCFDTVRRDVYIVESPLANFSTSDSIVCQNSTIDFLDLSIIDPLSQIESWFWDFGNGDTSILQNPSYTYDLDNAYTVTLEVTDTFGCFGQAQLLIDVLQAENILANDTFVCFGDSVQLQASGSVNYFWTPNYFIIDENTSTPTVFPPSDTTYLVQGLDDIGCSTFDSVFVQVKNVQADFSFTPSCNNDTTFFTDLSSALNGIVSTWNWNFGNPISGTANESSIQNPFHIFQSSGDYDVFLEVQNDFGCFSDTLITITIDQTPSANFVADSICLGLPTSFDATLSSGGTGNILSYEWNFGFNGETSTSQNPTFTYSNAGTYNVCLTITTDLDCPSNLSDTCINVFVYENPTASFLADSACLGSINSFENNSTIGDGQVVLNFWDFGQNIQDTIAQNDLFNSDFTYNDFGVFNVTLTIEDEYGCSSSQSNLAYVFDNPIADFIFNTVCENQNNEFISVVNSGADNVNNLTQYLWNFDDGNGFIIGDSIQNYNFQLNGSISVSLAVIDAFGCSDTTNQSIEVNEAPFAQITPSDTVVCDGESIELDASNSIIANNPATFGWDLNFNTGINQVDEIITFLPTENTVVALFVQDAFGCADTAFQEITFLENPIADFDFEPACENVDFELNSTSTSGTLPINDFIWNIDGNILNGENTIFNHLVGNDNIDVELVVIDEHGCNDTLLQTINIEAQPIINVLQTDYLVCLGGGVQLTVNDSSLFEVSGVDSYQWTPSFGIDDPLSDTIFMSPNISTIYTIIGFSANNICPPAEVQIFVDIIPLPQITIDATPNPILAGNASDITVNVVPYNAQTDSLIWTDVTGTLSPLLGGNVQASPLEETTYDLTLVYNVDSVSCSLDTTVTIEVLDKCDGEIVYIPNIFTPNNDGKNDIFKISGVGLNNISRFIVFDRWGKVMYEEVNIPMINGRMQGGWNGSNQNGKDCNSGVYVYRYEATCVNGDEIEGSGNVTLIK